MGPAFMFQSVHTLSILKISRLVYFPIVLSRRNQSTNDILRCLNLLKETTDFFN